MNKPYRVGTRTSPLAIKQVEEIVSIMRQHQPNFSVEIVGIDTYGDKDKITPISDIEGSDFFTREIDEAILKGEIDFAVHSAKDLPDIIPDGLTISAITKSIDPYDVVVSKGNKALQKLPHQAKVGTSSLRRKTQLKAYRSDLKIVDLRGNIEERLNKLDSSDMDAIVIAAAGLVRLGLEDRIAQRVPFDILRPHPLQGSLAIMTKDDNRHLQKLFSVIDIRNKSASLDLEP